MTSSQLLQLVMIHAVQIAVLATVVAVLVRSCGRTRPWLAHGLWLLVLLKCVTPPVWGHSLGVFCQSWSPLSESRELPSNPPQLLPQRPVHEQQTLLSRDVPSVVPDESEAREPINPPATRPPTPVAATPTQIPEPVLPQVSIFLLWILAAGAVLNVLLLGGRCGAWLRRVFRQRDGGLERQLQDSVARLAAQLEVRCPRLVVSEAEIGPAVIGVFRPAVVLPRRLVRQQTAQELRLILAHELLHIRRRDLWTGWLQAAARCIWWFHPAVQLACRALSYEAERCCDEQVLAELNCPPSDYARSLLAVMEHRQLPAAPVFPGVKSIELTSQRMERIMSLTNGCRTRTPYPLVACLVVLGLLVLPGAAVSLQTDEQSGAAAVSRDEAPKPPSSAQSVSKSQSMIFVPPETLASPPFRQLMQQLTEPVSFESPDLTLPYALERLARTIKLNIVLESSAVEDDAGNRSTETLDCSIEGVPLRTVLTVIADRFGVEWDMQDEVVYFSRTGPQSYSTKQYDLTDVDASFLAASGTGSDSAPAGLSTEPNAEYDRLIDAIRASARPNSWSREGSIMAELHGHVLHVRQTKRGHLHVERLLDRLREATRVRTRLVVIDIDQAAVPEGLHQAILLPNTIDAAGAQVLSDEQRDALLRHVDSQENAHRICDGLSMPVPQRTEFGMYAELNESAVSVVAMAHDAFGSELEPDCPLLRLQLVAQLKGNLHQENSASTPETMLIDLRKDQTVMVDLTPPDREPQSTRTVLLVTPELVTRDQFSQTSKRLQPATSGFSAPANDSILQTVTDELAIREESFSNVRIVKELTADRMEEAREVPMVGTARLHHRRFKCTVYWDQVVEAWWPIPFTHTTPMQHTVYVNQERLVYE